MRAVLVLLAASALAAPAAAWGPISHYFYTCSSLRSGQTPAACVANTGNADLLRGADLPDAFFFGSFLSGSTCVGFGELHNAVFAGYMVQQARAQLKADPSSEQATANLNVALGFGSHVVADAAGFLPGGYLGSGHLPPQFGRVDWLSVWPFMQIVDNYYMRNASIDFQTLPQSPLSAAGAAFIAESSASFATSPYAPPGFPVISSAAAFNCTSAWSSAINRINRVTAEPYIEHTEHMLPFYDVYGASSFQEAEAHLDMARNCAITATDAWTHAITAGNDTPLGAYEAVITLYEKMFSEGLCAPTKA